MTVEEFLAAACIKKGLNPVEHFARVKKRKDMPNMKYFVPHRSDLIETYVSSTRSTFSPRHFFHRSSRIRVESIPTDKREHYDWRAWKKLDGRKPIA